MSEFAKAQKRAKELKEEYGYRLLPIACCLTCKNSIRHIDDLLLCTLLRHDAYLVDDVSEIGLCDKFEND